MLNPGELDKLYEQYGFFLDKKENKFRVYIKPAGYFLNAEVVPLSNEAKINLVVEDYQASGYSCRVQKVSSIKEIEKKLFEGFFQVDATRKRLKIEYDQFCERKSISLGSMYEYVEAPYSIEGKNSQNGNNIIQEIYNALHTDGPALVLLEAAAGFGKTCTTYELLNFYLEDKHSYNPIVAELQRNRQARIFKYVLYDEMNRNYNMFGLSYELVNSEIKSGKIPLFIDGFDELLHDKRQDGVDEDTSDVEPMLRTLSEILVGDAKLLVTTRRTAILGEHFEKWIEERLTENVEVYRFTIKEPDIEHWIGGARKNQLLYNNIPIHSLANPVLLAYLRNVDTEEFSEACTNSSGLVDKYFDSLLNRERGRQELPLNSCTQMIILTSIATQMLRDGLSSFSRDTVKQIILREHYNDLNKALQSAPDIAARTPDELADKLTDHVLFDSRPGSIRLIGFINDFVYGTLAGNAMLDTPKDEWFDESDMDKSVTAYSFRNKEDKRKLWERLCESVLALDESWQVHFDVRLYGFIRRDLKDCTIKDIEFLYNFNPNSHYIKNVIFVQCVFKNNKFNLDTLIDVGFIGCEFHDCTNEGTICSGNIWFDAECIEYNGEVTQLSTEEHPIRVSNDEVKETDFEREVLEQFWPIGRESAKPVLQVTTLYQGFPNYLRSKVVAAIVSLKAKGLIFQNYKKLVRLDFTRMKDIREIINR